MTTLRPCSLINMTQPCGSFPFPDDLTINGCMEFTGVQQNRTIKIAMHISSGSMLLLNQNTQEAVPVYTVNFVIDLVVDKRTYALNPALSQQVRIFSVLATSAMRGDYWSKKRDDLWTGLMPDNLAKAVMSILAPTIEKYIMVDPSKYIYRI